MNVFQDLFDIALYNIGLQASLLLVKVSRSRRQQVAVRFPGLHQYGSNV